jgi:hypothetical protein
MPTLIAAGRRATDDGTPVVQRLDLTWPELAAEGASRNDQYLFADGGMLVAPIIPFNGSDPVAKNPTNGTGNSSRTVWVPPGSWQDAWSGTVVAGPKTVQVTECPLDQIPMWPKKGSVLVTAAPAQNTKEQSWDELALEIFPFALGNTDSAEEDVVQPLRSYTAHLHDTKADAMEEVPRTNLRLDQHATSGAATVHIGAGASRRWKLRIHLLPGERLSLEGVTVDGVSTPFAVLPQYTATTAGKSHALIAPQLAVAVDGESAGVTGSVLEAVVQASTGVAHTVKFEVIV